MQLCDFNWCTDVDPVWIACIFRRLTFKSLNTAILFLPTATLCVKKERRSKP